MVRLEDELRDALSLLQQEVTDARVLFHEQKFYELNNLLHRIERQAYQASIYILDIADLVG